MAEGSLKESVWQANNQEILNERVLLERIY